MHTFFSLSRGLRTSALAALLLAVSGFLLYAEPDKHSPVAHALPLVFEQNQGQFPAAYDFVARHAGGKVGLSADAITFALPGEHADRPLRIRWQGAQADAPATALQPLATRTHYLRPGRASISDLRNFGRVAYRSILPGVDIEYYGNRDRLEFDFVLAPGAPLDALRLAVEGADAMTLDADGNLRIERDGHFVLQHRPFVYQKHDGVPKPVESRYVLISTNIVGFEVDSYDLTKPLVVDPIIEFATFFGGNGLVSLYNPKVDADGNVYAIGTSLSTLLPGESLPPVRLPGIAASSLFITKISPDWSSAIFTTYISWAAPLTANFGLAHSPDGGIYFAYRSATPSSQIPVTRPVIGNVSSSQTTSDFYRTVLGKLAPNGASLLWTTVAGCDGSLNVPVLTVDSQSRAILAGDAACADFPTSPGAFTGQGEVLNTVSAALLAVNPDGDSVAYAILFGGSAGETVTHVAVNSNDEPILAGTTSSPNFPVSPGAVQGTTRGLNDAFFMRFSSDGNHLLASTLYGGGGQDSPTALAVDAQGGVTAAIDTASLDLAGTGGSFQPALGSSRTALLRLNPGMSAITWATYFPGVHTIPDIAVNAAGETWVLGASLNAGVPVTSQRLLAPNGWAQGYLGRINASATIVTLGTAIPGLSDLSPPIRLLGTPGTTARILGNSYGQDLPPESPGATLMQTPVSGQRKGTYLMRLNLADPTSCSFSISPSQRNVPWHGGDAEFDVSAPAGCPWIVTRQSSESGRYTLLQQQGLGPGKFRVRIHRNPSSIGDHDISFSLLGDFVKVVQAPAACTEPSLSPSSLAYGPLGGIRNVTLDLPDGCSWTAQLNATWFTTSLPVDLRGTGSRTFAVSAAPNSFEARASSIAIAGLTLPIQQTAGTCTAAVTATPASIAAAGGVSTIQVTPSDGACAWQASATSRVQLGAGSSATGSGSFTATLPANPTNVAMAETVHVAGKTVTLNQAAGQCAVSLVPTATSFGSQAAQVVIRVNATGTACAWFPRTNASWITIPAEMLSKQGTGDFHATFGANSTGATRSGTITILGQSVTISQQSLATVAVQVSAGAIGVPFKANGVTHLTPHTLNLPVGTPVKLEAAVSEFVSAEHELLVFERWSNGTGLTVNFNVQQNNPGIQLLGPIYMGVRALLTGNSPGDGSRVAIASSTPLYKTIGDWMYFQRSLPGSQLVGVVTFTAIPGAASRFLRWRTDRQGSSTSNPATFSLMWPIPVIADFEPLGGTPVPVSGVTLSPASLSFQATVGTPKTLSAAASVQKSAAAEVTFSAPSVVCDGTPNIPFAATVTALTTPFTLTVTLNTAQISTLAPSSYTNCIVRLQPVASGQQAVTVPLTLTVLAAGTGVPRIEIPVDAAGYRASPLAIGSIASVFGTNLAYEAAHAESLPLPVELRGARLVLSRDAVVADCRLFYVSPGQINFLIPDEFPTGQAYLTFYRDGVLRNSAPITITDVRPSLFSANASGAGPAAGFYVRVEGNSQEIRNLVECPASGACQSVAIQPPASASGRVYLVLFGTGIRYRASAPTVDIGGVPATVDYSGPQGEFVGLDQVNILVPPALLGTGLKDVRLRIGNQQSNAVGVRF